MKDPHTAIGRACGRLDRAVADTTDQLRYFNDPDIQEAVGDILEQVREFLHTHAQSAQMSIADDCANLIGVIEQIELSEDFDEQPLDDRMKMLRGHIGGVLGSLMAILRAAAALGIRTAPPEQALPFNTQIDKQDFGAKLDTLAVRVSRVETILREEVEPETGKDRPLVETLVTTPYVAEMKLNLGVVGSLLRVGKLFDLSVLERAVSKMASATRDLVATIHAATSVATAALRRASLRLRDSLGQVRRSARNLIEGALKAENRATLFPGPDVPDNYMDQAIERICTGQPLPSNWIPFLTMLDLRGRTIDGPKLLGGLHALRVLHIDDPAFDDCTALSELKRLRVLDLGNTKIRDLTAVCGLSDLIELRFPHTEVTDLSPVASLQALEFLDLSYTAVNDLSPVAGLRTLRELHARYSSVTDISALRPLDNLQGLDISGTRVKDVSPLATAAELRSITLLKSAVEDTSSLSALANLKNVIVDPA